MVIKKGLASKSILFVDDNKTIQKIVGKIIDESRFRLKIFPALTGEDALDILNNETTEPKPSMILLDLNLPAMNGGEVLENIQRDDNLKDIPVIVLTASDDAQELEALKKNGARECHTKPFDFFMFNSLVEKIIDKWVLKTQAPTLI